MMKAFFKIICLLPLLLSNAQAANIVASLDRNPILLDESFRLVLEADSSVDGDPDFSVLLKDFDILSQSQSTNMTFVNGSFSHKGVWNLALMGKKPGTFTIPPIPFGKDQSPSLRITIKDPATSPNTSVNSREIYLESEVDQKSTWIQAPIIYTIRLFSSVALTNLRTSELKTSDPDAIIEQLGEARTYEAFRGGSRFAVREIRYVVYPQHSGELTFEPMIFEGRVSQGGPRSIFDQYLSTGELKRLRSNSLTIEVRPRPSNIKAAAWLPAEKVTLVEEWSGDVTRLKAGEPVTRTISILANGPLANSIPDMQLPDIEGLKQYPDKPLQQSKAEADGVTSLKEIKIALIPTRAGEYTIPAISLPWWNIKTGKQEIAHLPQTRLSASGATASASLPPLNTVPAVEADTAPAKANQADTTQQQIINAAYWPWLSLALGTGWLLTLLALLRKNTVAVSKTPKQPKTNLKALEKTVLNYSAAGNAAKTRDAMLTWAQARWPQHYPTSLTEISRLCSADLADTLHQLNAALYAAQSSGWNGAALTKAFKAFNRTKNTSDNISENPLEPLYRA